MNPAQREERSESFRRTALWVLVSGACYPDLGATFYLTLPIAEGEKAEWVQGSGFRKKEEAIQEK